MKFVVLLIEGALLLRSFIIKEFPLKLQKIKRDGLVR
jgi:hypothetical protein